MSSEAGNQCLALVAPQSRPPTFLTLPQEIRDLIYHFCGYFDVEQVDCRFATMWGNRGAQIFYVCRQVFEEIQPRFYNSRCFMIDTSTREFIKKIGVRNARSVSKLFVDWHISGEWGRPLDTLDELRLLGVDELRGLREVTIKIPDPWTWCGTWHAAHFQTAMDTICEISQDGRFPNLFGKKVFAGYTVFEFKENPRPVQHTWHSWFVLKLGQTPSSSDDPVCLQSVRKSYNMLIIYRSLRPTMA